MFVCAELQDSVCVAWVEYNSLLTLPDGAGLKIGGALFLTTLTAWGISFIARVFLNR